MIILSDKKDIKSKKVIPKMSISDNMPFDKEDIAPVIPSTTVSKITAEIRFIPSLPVRNAISTSISDIADVTAANSTSKKNATATHLPKGTESNTAGKVRKISPGPYFGSKPAEKTAGITAKPERTAAMLSSAIMAYAEERILLSFLR